LLRAVSIHQDDFSMVSNNLDVSAAVGVLLIPFSIGNLAGFFHLPQVCSSTAAARPSPLSQGAGD